MTLRFDYDDTLTSILVHALQAIVEEMIFSTDTRNPGICAFPLSSADEFFIIPSYSSLLVLRRLSHHYVLRGPCLVYGFNAKHTFQEAEALRTGRVRIRIL